MAEEDPIEKKSRLDRERKQQWRARQMALIDCLLYINAIDCLFVVHVNAISHYKLSRPIRSIYTVISLSSGPK
jgi:hypothetical protein